MNNQRRALLVIYVLSIAISTILFSIYMSKNVHGTEYTSYTKSSATNEGVYFVENMEEYALLYRMNNNGRVLDILNTTSIGYNRIHALYVDNGNLYILASKPVLVEGDADTSINYYKIFELDSDLKTKRETRPYTIEEGYTVSSISIGKSGIYNTLVSYDGSHIKVVSLPADSFYQPDVVDDTLMSTENVMIKNADSGRFFVSAIYENGSLEYRTDKDKELDLFAENTAVSDAISNMKLSPLQEVIMYRTYFAFWIALTIVWLIVVTFIIRILATSNRLFYSFILMEVILAIVIGCSIYYVSNQYNAARSQEHTRFGIISLQGLAPDTGLTTSVNYAAEGYFDSDTYKHIQSKMADFVTRNGNSSVFYDAFIVRLSDGMVITSASGRNNEGAVYLFGNAASKVIDTLYSGSAMYSAEDTILSGQKCKVIGIVDTDFSSGYALMGVINDVNISSRFNTGNIMYIVFFIFVFAVGSAILTAIYYFQARDLKHLEDALKETALGRSLPERPITVGADLKNMWDSLTEVNKRVQLINYTKIKVLEAYYRFAPKNLEFALGKESIIDVKNSSKVNLSGSLLNIRTARAGEDIKEFEKMPGIESMIEKVELRQKKNDCVVVGNNSELSVIQILFLESGKGMVDFAADLIHDSNAEGKGFNSGFIFYDDFEFGIVGNSGLAFTYTMSGRSREFRKFGTFFQKLRLGLVITEYIKLRDFSEKSVRYIGYIVIPGSADKINLYEVMDACRQRERQAKLHTMRQFERAFEMYEQKDFYLARNLFSDLLKESPEDELARWYLFESEKYLNEGVENEATFGALHM